MLDNLVSNAVKYNRDDGVIEVGTTSDGPHVWIVVRDSGHGISPAEQAQVFTSPRTTWEQLEEVLNRCARRPIRRAEPRLHAPLLLAHRAPSLPPRATQLCRRVRL